MNMNLFTGYSFTFGPSIQLPPASSSARSGGTLTVTTVTRADHDATEWE